MQHGFRIYTHVLSVWKSRALLSAMIMGFSLSPVQAQYMQLQLIVQNEVSVSSPRNMNIGVVPPAFGWVQIGAEDTLAGRFVISAAENIKVYVNLSPPDFLQRDTINLLPFRMQASMQQTSGQASGKSIPFQNHQAYFSLHQQSMLRENLTDPPARLQATVMIHGDAYVGDVEAGVYYGEIGVRVEYE